jgi:hypothetical protein
MEYTSVTSLDADGVIPQIVKGLAVRDQTHPRNIYKVLTGNSRTKQKQFYFALEVLSHLRDNARLSPTDTRRLCPGSYLREHDRDLVLERMGELGLLGSLGSAKGAVLKKTLFPEILKVG